MQKSISTIFEIIQHLKSFHATHILAIVPTISFCLSFALFLALFLRADSTSEEMIALSTTFFFIYVILTCFSFLIAIITAIIILVVERIKKKRIRVQSKLLLHNKFYNLIYAWNLFLFATFAIAYITNFPFGSETLIAYLFFWPYMLILSWI